MQLFLIFSIELPSDQLDTLDSLPEEIKVNLLYAISFESL